MISICQVVFAILVLCTAASFSFAEWRKENSGSLAWFHAVYFLDANTGWVAGGNGTLLMTTDAGRVWTRLRLPASDTIRDVHFRDRLNGWLLCDRGRKRTGRNASYLLRTVDGGAEWTFFELKESTERFNRLFVGENSLFLIGEGGVLAEIPIGERSEKRFEIPVRFLMMDGVCLRGARIVLVGGGGSVIYTDEGGRAWQTVKFDGDGPENKLNAVYFLGDENGWTVGNGGAIFSTTDGGRRWKRNSSNTTADLFDIVVLNSRSGYAVGDNGIVLKTSDSGESWTAEKIAPSHRLERITVAGKKVFAVGFGGTIISTEVP